MKTIKLKTFSVEMKKEDFEGSQMMDPIFNALTRYCREHRITDASGSSMDAANGFKISKTGEYFKPETISIEGIEYKASTLSERALRKNSNCKIIITMIQTLKSALK